MSMNILGIEKTLIDRFSQMPPWVRVLTYLILLALYVYLYLAPRFIDGQLLVRDPDTHGYLAYRGAEIQMYVDGRLYKFQANEEGYWSVPVLSRLPEDVEIQVFHQDRHQWFTLKFTPPEIWGTKLHRVEVTDSKPYLLLGSRQQEKLAGRLAALPFLAEASAAELLLPSLKRQKTAHPSGAVTSEVVNALSASTGKSPAQITPGLKLTGPDGPSYVQRIKTIQALEKSFGLSIPDEHWKSIETVKELDDYLEKRKQLQAAPQLQQKPANASWEHIQQAFPAGQVPIFLK